MRLLRPALMLGGTVVLALATLLVWLFGGGTISTDDAYVDAAKVSLSTDVSGQVGEVDVHDNQHVRAGQVLFTLGSTSFAIAVAGARAQLALAVEDVTAAKHAYAEAEAAIAAQQAQTGKDEADLARDASVVTQGGVTRTEYDAARFAVQADQATLTQLQASAGQVLAHLSGNPDIAPQDAPQVLAAQAALDTALLYQRHSVVRAPFSGTVAGVEQLQPGMYLQAGTAAFGLVSDADIFVTAQPKEDQLTWVRPGQAVDITLDTYPGENWKGEVESLSPASGAEFSILPAQNSSGNWVKVVQRIPVRIKLLSGPNLPLLAGMSAEITIHTGHSRSLADLF
jgi:membrane fusion protein (multidrug efflux system)